MNTTAAGQRVRRLRSSRTGVKANLRLSKYARQATEQGEWLFLAETLRRSADIIAPDASRRTEENGSLIPFTSVDVFKLLSAFSLENAFKSRIAPSLPDREIAKLERTGELPEVLNTHDLCLLADRACFDCKPAERALLAKLEAFGVWRGRYPVSISSSSLEPLGRAGRRHLHPIGARREVVLITALVDRVIAWARKGTDFDQK